MSKRSRDGDVIAQRAPVMPPYRCHNTQMVGTKRSASFKQDVSSKRSRFELESVESVEECQKRAADFDIELNRLHKRMKATTPTAEHVMAFMLPHLIKMRELYLSELEKTRQLAQANDVLKKNNVAITRAFRVQLEKYHHLARQLDNAQYRLLLSNPPVHNLS